MCMGEHAHLLHLWMNAFDIEQTLQGILVQRTVMFPIKTLQEAAEAARGKADFKPKI